MARDSLFGEPILWSGRPKVVPLPRNYQLGAAAAASAAAMLLGFAVVSALALHAAYAGLLIGAAWCATAALAAWQGPRLYRGGLTYEVTEGHVVVRRGRFRRTIDRFAISYAIIRWNPRAPGVGDLVLVRAVPTGALRRTLTLVLVDLESPDRVWAAVRGVMPSATLGDGERPLGQRLDVGERVLWSGTPRAARWTARRALASGLAAVLFLAAARGLMRSVPALLRVLRLHALPATTFGVLAGSVALGALLAVGASFVVAYASWVKPGRLAKVTRYFVTNRRVLIRRGYEELSLDRGCIAYVITAPSDSSMRRLEDLFLVLDGPRARALAASGAFGEAQPPGDELVPMFSQIDDAETAFSVLQKRSSPSLPPPVHDAA